MDTVAISKSVTEDERASIGSLHWEAFGQKLRAGFANESTGMAVVRAADLIWPHLRCQLSLRGTLGAPFALSPQARGAHLESLVLDGSCVDSAARGLGIGIGAALLGSAIGHARRVGAPTVRLSVVDSNPPARALYERRGFAPVGSGALGPLSFAFDGRTTVELAVDR